MDTLEITLLIFTIISAIAIGSFLNVCIYRTENKNFFKQKRSYCPKCNHTLSAKDNIPILSFILLKGRCRYCKEKISVRYIIVEILNTVLYTAIFSVYRISFDSLILMILVSALIVMMFIDIDTMEIPDRIQITILVLALLTFIPKLYILEITWQDKLIGMVAISVPLLVIALITNGMGLGDVKLYFVLGLLFGWKYILLIFFFSVIFGAIAGLIIKRVNIKKNKEEKKMIPFGPYIAIATFIVIFIGKYIIELYSKLLVM